MQYNLLEIVVCEIYKKEINDTVTSYLLSVILGQQKLPRSKQVVKPVDIFQPKDV